MSHHRRYALSLVHSKKTHPEERRNGSKTHIGMPGWCRLEACCLNSVDDPRWEVTIVTGLGKEGPNWCS